MASSKQNTTSCLAYPDDVTGSWSTEDAVLADQELLDTIRSTDLGDELSDFWVPVAAISTDDKERSFSTLGNGLQDAGDEGLGVVLLLEDLDLLAEARTGDDMSAKVPN